MNTPNFLQQGRDAYRVRAWTDAYDSLSLADREGTLAPEDLQLLATAAHLIGRDADCADLWARAHQEFLDRGHVERAVRCAFWLAFGLLRRGEHARGGGWLSRAQRFLDQDSLDCAERGYLLLPVGLRHIGAGDASEAYAAFREAAEIAERFRDPDLTALALHSRGRVLIRMGKVEEGVALLDEAMAATEAGDVAPMVVGDVYCSVIEGCWEICDVRRAREWTSVLTRWCEAQPDLVPYRGQCLVRRAEILQLHGAWPDALNEARQATEWLSRPPGEPAAGAAFYQEAEIHRVRGEFTEAEQAYRQVARWGKKTQPGLARLRLAQGRVDDAKAAITHAVEEAKEPLPRSRMLATYVEIMLAADDVSAARAAADELTGLAAELDAALLDAMSAQSQGAVLLAEDDAEAAHLVLRHAWQRWEEIEAPYEAARARVLLARACRELGDRDTAEMELDVARGVFERLGAAPDLAHVEKLMRPKPSRVGGLTPREVEVLRLVAAGSTNRTIAESLFISEKTVARHVSNIFLKVGVSSRAAATAYAYEHDLV